MSEKERLVELAEALRSKMAYFDELERVAVQFHGASLDVDSDRFLPLLQRLDDCISCVYGSSPCSAPDSFADPAWGAQRVCLSHHSFVDADADSEPPATKVAPLLGGFASRTCQAVGAGKNQGLYYPLAVILLMVSATWSWCMSGNTKRAA